MNVHQKLHFALAAVYAATAVILFAEAAYAHSGCAAAAAAIYLLLALAAENREGGAISDASPSPLARDDP